jgi:Flp pilus assembly protein TadD
MPDYAEGWARSARLAMEEEDYSRALSDAAQALILEPREFYALWTMGNVFEKLGRTDEAYQAYIEALALYPEHPAIKSRVGTLQGKIDGGVL